MTRTTRTTRNGVEQGAARHLDLVTPFDDLDGATTIATPSCCCCCCCCLATVATTTVRAGAVIRDDLAEQRAAARATDDGVRLDPDPTGWIGLGATIPLVTLILAIIAGVNLAETGDGDGRFWVGFVSVAIVGALAYAAIRVRAGRSWRSAVPATIGSAVLASVAAVVEVFAVLATIGIIWVIIPFGVVWALRRRGEG